MNLSIITKAASFGFAAVMTLSILASLDALASSEQQQAAVAAANAINGQAAAAHCAAKV
jgi:hypothetical protein